MAFWKSLSNMFREKKAQAEKVLADPIRDGKFAIEDAEVQVRQYTTNLASLVAQTKLMSKQHEDAVIEKKKFERIAKEAGSKKNENDVRKAVEAIRKWTTTATELKTQIDKNESVRSGLQKQLDAARSKIACAKQNHQTLVVRQNGAQIRKSLAMASQTFADNQSGLASLDDLEKSVMTQEAEAEAFEEMAAPTIDESLETRYGSDSSSSDTDEMVAKFMK